MVYLKLDSYTNVNITLSRYIISLAVTPNIKNFKKQDDRKAYNM